MPDLPSSYGTPQHSGNPALLTTAFVDVATVDVFLDSVSFTNNTGGSADVTVQDRQGTPLAVIRNMSIDSSTPTIVELFGRFCPGGFSWKASAANVVVAWAKFRTR